MEEEEDAGNEGNEDEDEAKTTSTTHGYFPSSSEFLHYSLLFKYLSVYYNDHWFFISHLLDNQLRHKLNMSTMVEHTNATSFERFCCYNKQYRDKIGGDMESFEQLYNATKICFSDLNITYDQQLDILIDFIYGGYPYKEDDCPSQYHACATPTTPSHIGYMCLWVLLLIITVSSNFTVIMAVHKVSHLRDNVGNILISSLAVSDFFVGLFLIPIKMKFAYNNLNFCSLNLCRFYITADNALFSTSITNLFFISIDRYVALYYPFKHLTWMTLARCKVLIAGIWLYGFTWGSLSNINWQNIKEPSIHIRINQCLVNNNVYVATTNITVFYIPAVIIAMVYIRVLSIAKYHAKAISDSIRFENDKVGYGNGNATVISNYCSAKRAEVQPIPTQVDEVREKKSMNAVDKDGSMSDVDRRASRALQSLKYRKMCFKASKTVAIVYATFFCCWFPVSALSLALAFCRQCFHEYDLKWFYLVFVEILPIVHSMVNPFIYAFMNKQYRRAYKNVFLQLMTFVQSHCHGGDVKQENS